MSYPVSKNSATAPNDRNYHDGYDGTDLEGGGFEDPYYGDQYILGNDPSSPSETSPLSANDLREEIAQLESSLDPKDAKGRAALEKLKSQINVAVSFRAQIREAKFSEIQNQIDRIQSDLENLDGTGVDGSGDTTEGGTPDATALQAKKDDLKAKLEKYHSKGWITDDLYQTLSAELDKVDLSDSELLEGASQILDNLESSMDSIAGLYAESHEAVDQVDGVENKITEDQMPQELQRLMDLVPTMKGKPEKFLEKLLNAFPDLDANGDGTLSLQELKDGVAQQIFPPKRPNDALINFMTDLDPELKDKWDATTANFAGDNDGDKVPTEQKYPRYRGLMTDCNKRLVDLLNAVYGDGKVRMEQDSPTDWRLANNLVWTDNNQVFEAFREDTASRDVKVQWY